MMVSFEFDIDWGRAVWIAFGLVLALVTLWVLHSFIGTFVFALFLYYSTRRVHGEILDRVGQRSTAAALALFALALPAVLLFIYVIAIGLQELREFSETTELGPFLDAVRPYFDVSAAFEDPTTLLQNAGGVDIIRRTLLETSGYLGVVGTGLLHLFVMFSVAFYLLRDDHRLVTWAQGLDADWGVIEDYVVEVDRSFEKIFAGNILNALVTGSVGAIGYSLLNLAAPEAVAIPYPALIGLLTGIASLIPVIGMKIVYIPVFGYLAVLAWMANGGWGFVALFGAVSFVIVDVIPDLVVRPYVSGGNLHTGSLMFAYILGPVLFGWYGLFLGPVILVLVTHFVRIVVPELLTDEQPRPSGIDPPYLPQKGTEKAPPGTRQSEHSDSDDA